MSEGETPDEQFRRPVRRPALDHDGFGSVRSKIMNVIDSDTIEHDVIRKPAPTFRHHAPAASPTGSGGGSRANEGRVVSFDRHELREIFNLYGRRVAEGEWRDYAIDFTDAKAVFSIYRRSSEVPLYRVEKDPSLARRQGTYSVVAATGLILKRGGELRRVLQVLEPRPRLVVV